MVFLIQNSQNRDAAALHAKLDEVIRALRGARNDFIGVEHLSETNLEEIIAALEKESGNNGAEHLSTRKSLVHLRRRRR